MPIYLREAKYDIENLEVALIFKVFVRVIFAFRLLLFIIRAIITYTFLETVIVKLEFSY